MSTHAYVHQHSNFGSSTDSLQRLSLELLASSTHTPLTMGCAMALARMTSCGGSNVSSLDLPTFMSDDPERLAACLRYNGFAVITTKIPTQLLCRLSCYLKLILDDHRQREHQNREDTCVAGMLPLRFCINDNQHFNEPCWLDLLNEMFDTNHVVNKTIEQIFEPFDRQRRYHCDMLGGDVVLPCCSSPQKLHNDWSSCPLGISHNGCLALSVAIEDVPFEKAAMRIIPRPTSDASAFEHPPMLESEPSQWKNARVPLKKGQILIRNVQVWHGGTPNCTTETRILPGIRVWGHELIQHGWRPRRCLPNSLWVPLKASVQKRLAYKWTTDNACALPAA